MYYNKTFLFRLSEEMLDFIHSQTLNSSKFMRNLIRKAIKKGKKKEDIDRTIRPEIRAKTPYTFYADLTKIIDGDTLQLNANLGFYVNADVTIRLSGINAFHLKTKKGKEAVKFLRDRLRRSHLVVESRQKGKFGRYIGYVYYHRSYTKFEDILRHGKVINEELLKSGLATKYKN